MRELQSLSTLNCFFFIRFFYKLHFLCIVSYKVLRKITQVYWRTATKTALGKIRRLVSIRITEALRTTNCHSANSPQYWPADFIRTYGFANSDCLSIAQAKIELTIASMRVNKSSCPIFQRGYKLIERGKRAEGRWAFRGTQWCTLRTCNDVTSLVY